MFYNKTYKNDCDYLKNTLSDMSCNIIKTLTDL